MGIRSAKKSQLAAACPDITLGDELGAGGNARVYAGVSKTHGSVAVKFMLNDDTKRYGRFKDEVLVVTTTLLGSKHVLPIFDHHLPVPPLEANSFPWYSMPVARRFSVSIAGKSWSEKLTALAELADGLASIHALNVAHRDIKPDNLFELDGAYRFGDFGIASFPNKSGLTRLNEPMGPWAFMAPEMLSEATAADPFKADVYAFAKTVWCILVEKRVPFIGNYVADSADGLANFHDSGRFTVEPLDTLLEASTRVTADQRPTAQQFANDLKQAISVQDDYRHANSLQWQAAELAALRTSGLMRAVWSGAAEIAEVLTLMGRRVGMNHCFFPDGGGHTVKEAIACEGGEMLALRLESMGLSVVKPVRLTLERFPRYPELSYLVLETADVAPLGTGERYRSAEAEYLKMLNDSDYAVDDAEDDEPHNAGKGEYCERRFKGGDFIIAPTTGVFNHIDEYEGTEGKAGHLHALFEEYALKLESVNRGASGPTLQRKVRLLQDTAVADHKLELEYIDAGLLERLIEVDDALVDEREEGDGITISGDDLASICSLLDSEQTPAETGAWQLLSEMTNAQRAEFMTLVNLARGHLKVWNAKECTASAVGQNWESEDAYLFEKFGNGYMRKALARYGLEWSPVGLAPQPQPLQFERPSW